MLMCRLVSVNQGDQRDFGCKSELALYRISTE